MRIVESETERADRRAFIDITFQEGVVHGTLGSDGVVREVYNGCFIEDVIDVLVERLQGFNQGNLRCRENSLAITHLEEAANWLVRRRINRTRQGVHGTDNAHV